MLRPRVPLSLHSASPRRLAAPLIIMAMLAVVVGWLSACGGGGRMTRVSYNNGVKVAGVVTYRQRIALPEDATITVRLLDTTNEAAPTVLAQQRIVRPGQVPLPFVLAIDPRLIDQNRNYAVEATITMSRRPVWRSIAPQAVITRGNPTVGLTIWVEQNE